MSENEKIEVDLTKTQKSGTKERKLTLEEAAAELLSTYSEKAHANAMTYVIERKRYDQDAESAWIWYIGGNDKPHYRVQLTYEPKTGDLWITCNCPSGLRSSQPRCYHEAAALMLVSKEHKPA